MWLVCAIIAACAAVGVVCLQVCLSAAAATHTAHQLPIVYNKGGQMVRCIARRTLNTMLPNVPLRAACQLQLLPLPVHKPCRVMRGASCMQGTTQSLSDCTSCCTHVDRLSVLARHNSYQTLLYTVVEQCHAQLPRAAVLGICLEVRLSAATSKRRDACFAKQPR
jgi:hypothetical protein